MVKEWIIGTEGKNLKFKREAILNYGMNRWGLNKAHSVGATSELIRISSPSTFEDYKWKEMQETSHRKFQKKFGEKAFIVFSVRKGKKKVIHNPEVIEEIRKEIERLEKEF